MKTRKGAFCKKNGSFDEDVEVTRVDDSRVSFRPVDRWDCGQPVFYGRNEQSTTVALFEKNYTEIDPFA